MANTLLLLVLGLTANTITVESELKFPKDFKFGVATASYQIEGGWNASGKGENIWDRLTHKNPKSVIDGKNGDIACDSYHLWRKDIALLKNLGVHMYRFSLSWSRLLPTGFTNRINPDGVRYYNNIINDLLQNNIEPIVTLYHWDLPQPLQDLGGWTNPLMATYFEYYAKFAFTLFGDRVKTWTTFNEPYAICESSYGDGNAAPAIVSAGIGDYICGRTVLLSHARAYHVYDTKFKSIQRGIIGIVLSAVWNEPKSNSIADILASERAMQMDYGWWAHPILSKQGDYPTIMKERIANISKLENFTRSRLPAFSAQEVEFIRGTFDFVGLNHYTTWLVSNAEYDPHGPTSHTKDKGIKSEQDPSWEPSGADWVKVVPWGFRKLLNWIKNEYNNPLIYITENGFPDQGELNDMRRIHYYQGYLKALLNAIYLDNCNVKAYMTWSLLDNMEWVSGYTLKFGLTFVDFDDPKRTRTPKASTTFFKKLIATRSIPEDSTTPAVTQV